MALTIDASEVQMGFIWKTNKVCWSIDLAGEWAFMKDTKLFDMSLLTSIDGLTRKKN